MGLRLISIYNSYCVTIDFRRQILTSNFGPVLIESEEYPVSTKHLFNICTMLDQRRRRWFDVVQMLYKWVHRHYQYITLSV